MQHTDNTVGVDPSKAYQGTLKGARFVKNSTHVIRIDQIVRLDLTHMPQFLLKAQLIDGSWMDFERLDAIETLLALKPSAVEGNVQIRWKKNAWIIHNLIAHPLMQILALLRLRRLALWIHDVTVPGIDSVRGLKKIEAG